MSLVESRLLTALSELGKAQGSGLVSDSLGEAPEELVKAFEDALDSFAQEDFSQEDFSQEDFSQNLAQENLVNDISSTENIDISELEDIKIEETKEIFPSPAEKMPSLTEIEEISTQKVERVDAVSQSQSLDLDNMKEKNTFTIEGKNIETKSVESVESTSSSPKSEELLEELQSIIESFSNNGSIESSQLFRIQYIMGMLKIQFTSGMEVSKSFTEGMESFLKNN